VYVDGLVAGADVVLSVGGIESSHTATTDAHNFTVPPLGAGAVVKARQDAGSGYSPWSPEVVVEDALVPPAAAPVLPAEVGICSHCVRATNLVPGSQVKLSFDVTDVGQGTANRNGNVCVGVHLKKRKGKDQPGSPLRARMYVCDVAGPESTAPLVPKPSLPKPVVGSPLFACQRIVPLSNLRRGSKVRLETNTGTNLGSFCSCSTAVKVRIGTELATPEKVRAQAYFEGQGCAETGPWGDWQLVVPPDEGITPTVLEALVEGDQIIRVGNQILGATLLIRIQPSEGDPAEEFGPRPASEDLEIGLNAPLVAGNVVSVVQTLCSVSMESEAVPVLPKPPVVLAPVIIPPLYPCGAAVQVSNLHQGALVRVYLDGIPIGIKWAGEESSVSVPLAPVLVAAGQVTARQWVGGTAGPESAPVTVLTTISNHKPRIIGPVALGDAEVWVSGVSPGAHVTIWSGGALIGEADAAEPIVRVPVSPVSGSILPEAKLCNNITSGQLVSPITSPCAAGHFPSAGEKFVSYDDSWPVPGAGFDTRIQGQLYFPGSGETFDRDARNLPLVVIAHGYFSTSSPPNDVETFTGYDYLARHLARWGMVVFSVNMNDVNLQEGSGYHDRAEIILKAVDEVLSDATLDGKINKNRIGLVGHSVAGYAVVVAQFLNESESRGYGIRGVVSIAPFVGDLDDPLPKTKHMQLLGSMDSRLGDTGGKGGFAVYSHASRPKTHFWIIGARHNPFNRRWVAEGDPFEAETADEALPPQDHERIAKCLINAFFQDALRNQTQYAGYMSGTVLPQSLHELEIHTQHSRGPDRFVLDNFGDADQELGVPVAPLEKTTNTQGENVAATGPGLGEWNDIEFTTLHPQDTKVVELGWTEPNVRYTSNTGGISRVQTDVFALRVGQVGDETLNPVDQPVDLFVTLSDGADEATVRLGAVSQIPYPLGAAPMKTVRLPLDAFKAANPFLAVTNIQSIALWTAARATGHIVADDLEFSR
jgi:hypothetical protein